MAWSKEAIIKTARILSILTIAFAMVASVAPVAGAATAEPDGSWIVVLEGDGSGVSLQAASARGDAMSFVAAEGGTVTSIYRNVLNGFAFVGTATTAAELAATPGVASVSPNGTMSIAGDGMDLAATEIAPNGILRSKGWNAHVNGYEGVTDGGTPIRIAVLDTGVDTSHTDLNLRTADGKDCINDDLDPDDDHGHGTHVAGTTAALYNGSDVVGMATGAEIVAIKVLDNNGSGSDEEVICGLDHVAALVAGDGIPTVINMSLGEARSEGAACDSSPLHTAICSLYDDDITVVAAAGNTGLDQTFYPAAFPEAIAVSAFTDLNGEATDNEQCPLFPVLYQCDEAIASFSTHGTWIDVTAPGVNVLSTGIGGGTAVNHGTSMASPHVAGAVALMLGANPDLDPDDVREVLTESGECPDGSASGATTCTGKGAWTMNTGLGATTADPDATTEPLLDAYAAAVAAETHPTDDDPVVWFDDPTEGTLVKGLYSVHAHATDDLGPIDQAEFFVDGSSIGVDDLGAAAQSGAEDELYIDWDTTASADGDHTLSVVATDNTGNTSSDSIMVTVGNAEPTITIDSPHDGASLRDTVMFSATALDATGIDRVDFYVDDNLVGTDSTPGGATAGAYEGYLAGGGSTRVGQDGVTNGSSDMDLPAPTASMDVRWDMWMGDLIASRNVIGVVGGSGRREWKVGLEGTDNLNFSASENGNAWDHRVESTSSSVASDTRMQFRLVMSGNMVSLHERDPLTFDSQLSSDSDWSEILAATDLGMDISDIASELAPLAFLKRTTNGGSQIPWELYEFRMSIDGSLVSSFAGGDVAINSDSFFDEQGNTWGWDNDTDPTQTANVGDSYTYEWDSTTIDDGTYTIETKAWNDFGNYAYDTISVTLVNNVVPDNPPSVTLTAPDDGTYHTGDVDMIAVATDDNGVTQVEFYVNDTLVATDGSTPGPFERSFASTSFDDGSYTLTAVAEDTTFQQTTSAGVDIVIDNTDPTITITDPSESDTLGGLYDVTATASDNIALRYVKMKVDGVEIAKDWNAPYVIEWDTSGLPDGDYTVNMYARDEAGNTSSDSVTVTVDQSVAVPRAYAGYLDAGPNTRIGQNGVVKGVSDADVGDATNVIDIRVDTEFANKKSGRNIVSLAGGSKRRQWRFGLAGSSELGYSMSSTGSAWQGTLKTSGATVSTDTRMQYRVLHSGTTVTIYERDPSVTNRSLSSDEGWIELVTTSSFGVDVANMANENRSPLNFYRKTKGGVGEMAYRLYEFRLVHDGGVVSSFQGGAATIAGNGFDDEQANPWSWSNDQAPTQVPN